MTQQEQNQTEWSLKDGIVTATIKADPNAVVAGPAPAPVSVEDLPKSDIPLMSDADAKKIEAAEAIKDRRGKHVQIEDYNPMPEQIIQDRMRFVARQWRTFIADESGLEPNYVEACSLLDGGATMIDRLQDMAKNPPMPAIQANTVVKTDEEFLAMMLAAEKHPVRRWLSHLAYNLGDWLQP